MEDIKISIAKRIKFLRKKINLSQEGLANSAEVDRAYMTDIESGKRNISVSILNKIVKALGLTLSEFFKDKSFGSAK
jgi:transcriptional regulator with XRE-family HTH domain